MSERAESSLLLGLREDTRLLSDQDVGPHADSCQHAPTSRNRRWLGTVSCVAVMIIALALFVAALLVPTGGRSGSQVHTREGRVREPIGLEEALLGKLKPKSLSASWLALDGNQDGLLYNNAQGDLCLGALGGAHNIGELHDGVSRSASSDSRAHSGGSQAHLEDESDNRWDENLFAPPGANILFAKNNSLLDAIELRGYKLSPSRRYLLMWTDLRPRFRSSFWAKYFLYDTARNLVTPLLRTQSGADGSLGATGAEGWSSRALSSDDALSGDIFQLAEWFQTEPPSRGEPALDSLILAHDNDLYALRDVSQPKLSPLARLTRTGQPEVIFNGIADYCYDEMISGDGYNGAAVSPEDGRHLAYMSINDSQVSVAPIEEFTDQSAVPRVLGLRQPLAGEPLPVVRLHIIENFATTPDDADNHAGPAPREALVKLPPEFIERQHYLWFPTWLTRDKLAITWYARDRSEWHVLICQQDQRQQRQQVSQSESHDRPSWTCERSMTVRTPPEGGWLEAGNHVMPLDERAYLALMPKFEGERVGEFNHLARVSIDKPDEFEFLTSGRRAVDGLRGVDPGRSLAYYTSTAEDEPAKRHLFVTSLKAEQPQSDGGTQPESTCLTCDLYPDRCMLANPVVSKSTRYFILDCEGPDIPWTELRELVHDEPPETSGLKHAGPRVTSRLVRTIEDNRELRHKLARVKATPVTVRLQVPIADTDYMANVKLLLPPPLLAPETDFRDYEHPGGAEQLERYTEQMTASASDGAHASQSAPPFPMIVDVYAGPAGMVFADYAAQIKIGHYFASSMRTVYAFIDGRGSGLEGSRRQFELFGQLGAKEIEDQIQVTRDLLRGPLARLVDPARVGIWGWSYGGYAAPMALARSNAGRVAPERGVFECAAAMGGPTDWLLYHSGFSERILRSPWKNERYDRHALGDHNSPSASAHDGNRTTSASIYDDVNERYMSSSLLEHIGGIRGKRFLLLHSHADDNVHIQHAFKLMQRMVQLNVDFESQLYPNQNHSLPDSASKVHMHRTLSKFFASCFKLPADKAPE